VRIDRALNLVVPVDTSSGTVYVHSTPIGRPLFELYFKVFRKAATEMLRDGIEGAIQVGPATALLDIRDAAQSIPSRDRRTSMWEGPDGVEAGLLPEMRRLTNVFMGSANGSSGWRMVPFQECIDRRDVLSEDDVDQIENAISFFTVFWWIMRGSPEVRTLVLTSMASLKGAVITSSSCTECLSSLQTSSVTASSGVTESTSWLRSLITSPDLDLPNSGVAPTPNPAERPVAASGTTAPSTSSATATSSAH
jgi:hypothetical protein